MTRLLVDVDGVIANFIGLTLQAIKKETGRSYTEADIVEWDIFKLLDAEEKRVIVKDYLNAPGFASKMAPYPDAIAAVKALAEAVDVVFVTADWMSSQTWVNDRNKWLRGYFGREQGKRVIHTSCKECVVGTWFIDDKIDNVLLWLDHHPEGQAFLWKRPYNQDFPETERVIHTNDWEAVKAVCLTTT